MEQTPALTVAAAAEPKTQTSGGAVSVQIEIQNLGDAPVFYTHGSSRAKTPSALVLESAELQIVRPRDLLGILTMDMVTGRLAPGERLQLEQQALLFEPSAAFDDHSFALMMREGVYIADLAPAELMGRFPELRPLGPGVYKGKAGFGYWAEPSAGFAPAGPGEWAWAEFSVECSG